MVFHYNMSSSRQKERLDVEVGVGGRRGIENREYCNFGKRG